MAQNYRSNVFNFSDFLNPFKFSNSFNINKKNRIMTQRTKAVILDFDGTLGDTRSLIVRTMQQTINELGLPSRTDGHCAAMIGLPLKQTFTELIPMSDAMGDRCAEVYRRIFMVNNKPGAVPLFPNVADTMRRMHDMGLLQTIASSRLRGSLEAYLDDLALRPYVSYIVSASDTDRAKPLPDMVLMTLEALSLRPEEAIVVGDTVFDVRMAHSAGVRAAAVTYGNGKREELISEKAEWILDDFSELIDIIK